MMRLFLAAAMFLHLAACGAGERQPAAANSNSIDGAYESAEATQLGVTNVVQVAEAAELPRYDPGALPGIARIADKAYFLKAAKWTSNTIPACFEDAAEADRPEGGWVREAVAQTWEAASLVKIAWSAVKCASNAIGIRIKVSEEGPHTKGLGKQLDRKADGMVLNRSFASWSPSCASSPAQRRRCIQSIAVHEFGHALGFAHEQNRPEAPGECAAKRQGTDGDLMLTPYDLQSVMNYCNPAYNNNGVLSTLDKKAVAEVYS